MTKSNNALQTATRPLSEDEMRRLAPSIFATEAHSNRHYADLARIILDSCIRSEDKKILIEEMSDAFTRDNVLFDRTRFVAACSGSPLKGKDKR